MACCCAAPAGTTLGWVEDNAHCETHHASNECPVDHPHCNSHAIGVFALTGLTGLIEPGFVVFEFVSTHVLVHDGVIAEIDHPPQLS